MLDNTIIPETEDQTCPAVGYQNVSVCVPVTVTPFAQTGKTSTKCCGTATVTPGQNTCQGTRNGACVFTISQNLCVAIPVKFGATAQVGDTFVNCNNATAENSCTGCGQVPSEPAAEPTAPTAQTL